MPGFNRKGPFGQGPGSGRGLGLCQPTTDNEISDPAGSIRGAGRGDYPRGGGAARCFGGLGQCRLFKPNLSQTKELEILRADLAASQAEVTSMKKRLEELEKKG